MILYPAIYTICTIPLAAGRIASMAGQNVSLAYFCVAGSMIACNGWLDTILYGLTRRSIVFSESAPGDGVGIQTFWALEKTKGLGNVTTIEGGAGPGHARGTLSSSASTEHLYGMGIKVEATVNVRREDADIDQAFELQHQKSDSRERIDKASWETRSLEDL
jgi:hypothetical protein